MVLEDAVPRDDLNADDIAEFTRSYFNGFETKRINAMRYKQVGNEKMPDNCRLVVAIPTFHLEKNLYNTLSQYLNQDAKKKDIEFEIVVYVNGPPGINLTESTAYKQALQFQKDHPKLNVLICSSNYDKSEAQMGRIRKTLAAFILGRAARNENIKLADLVILYTDADLVKIEKEYISNYVESFDKNPKMGAIAGIYDYPMEDYYQNHLFLAVQRFNDILDIISLYKCNNIVFKGGNSAFRAKHYVQEGGINNNRRMGELRNLYKKIRSKDSEAVSFDRKKAKITTSARRQIMAMGKNVPIVSCHDTFGHENDLADDYQKPIDELQIPEIAYKITSESFTEQLETELKGLYNKMSFMMRKDLSDEEIKKVFIRAGFFSGIKISFNEKGELKVDDITKLKDQIIKKYDHN